jgi:hypothetical protein
MRSSQVDTNDDIAEKIENGRHNLDGSQRELLHVLKWKTVVNRHDCPSKEVTIGKSNAAKEQFKWEHWVLDGQPLVDWQMIRG